MLLLRLGSRGGQNPTSSVPARKRVWGRKDPRPHSGMYAQWTRLAAQAGALGPGSGESDGAPSTGFSPHTPREPLLLCPHPAPRWQEQR